MFSGNRFKVIVGLLISLILVVAACAPSPPPAPPPPAPPETLKIGVSAPLSGGAAIIGIGMVRAAELAAEEINAKGGIKVGGKTYNIAIVGEDDKYTSEGGVAVATRLIGQGIKLVIGPLSSAAYLAAVPTYEENKVIVQHMASSFQATAPDKPFGFRAFPGAVGAMCTFYVWLNESNYWPEVKTVYRLEPDDATGWDVDPCLRNAIISNGFEVLGTEFVPRGITDASALVMKIMAKKPDLVDTGCNTISEGVVILKTLRGAGYKGKYFGVIQPVGFFVQAAGAEAVEGALMWAADPESPLTPKGYVDFHNKYLKKYGEPPIVVAHPDAYNAVYSFALAIEKAGTLDTTKVRDILADLAWETIYGPTRWGGEDVFGIKRQIIVPITFAAVQGGKLKGLAVKEMKLYPPLKK